jgi:CubicO group peptidase (beta-lactamase class C family)
MAVSRSVVLSNEFSFLTVSMENKVTKEDKTSATPDRASSLSRRTFLQGSAGAAAALGTSAVVATPQSAVAQTKPAPVITPITEITTPISKAKEPFPIDFIRGAHERWSTPNWQGGGDDSVYYNLNIPAFFKTDTVPATLPRRVLERDIKPELDALTFTLKDGGQADALSDYLVGPKRVQAMMMAHKGKVVFEAFPGMNPNDYHIWMSASKTSAGLMIALLEAEGLVDLSLPCSTYAPQLQGSEWDRVTLKNAANMAVGLDMEESFENLSRNDTWIAKFFAAVFEGEGDEWIVMLNEAQPLPGEPQGTHFRYSSAITQVLTLAVEHVTGLKFLDAFNQRVWSKIGVDGPFMIALAPDGTAIGGGGNFTTAEDLLRYAMIYTPSWNMVSDERVVTPELYQHIHDMGDPAAYKGSTEEGYHADWFGAPGERNSCQWDCVFADGAMFKHGNMGQGIYVDPERDFCGMTFALGPNLGGPDHSPGYLRAAAKVLAGG